jgi:hypothetical protein
LVENRKRKRRNVVWKGWGKYGEVVVEKLGWENSADAFWVSLKAARKEVTLLQGELSPQVVPLVD